MGYRGRLTGCGQVAERAVLRRHGQDHGAGLLRLHDDRGHRDGRRRLRRHHGGLLEERDLRPQTRPGTAGDPSRRQHPPPRSRGDHVDQLLPALPAGPAVLDRRFDRRGPLRLEHRVLRRRPRRTELRPRRTTRTRRTLQRRRRVLRRRQPTLGLLGSRCRGHGPRHPHLRRLQQSPHHRLRRQVLQIPRTTQHRALPPNTDRRSCRPAPPPAAGNSPPAPPTPSSPSEPAWQA